MFIVSIALSTGPPYFREQITDYFQEDSTIFIVGRPLGSDKGPFRE